MADQAPPSREIAAAKINLALHVRGKLPDGRHRLETLFAFCTDGDLLEARFAPEPGGAATMSLEVRGPFAADLQGVNLIESAFDLLRDRTAEASSGSTAFTLTKNLPVASGIGGGSADAAAALRLMTSLWRVDPVHASAAAPQLGADVPACLLSLTARGDGAGDDLRAIDAPDVSGLPILLINPRAPLSTGAVFAAWDGQDRGPLSDDWRSGRNDLETPASALVPAIGDVLAWLRQRPDVTLARMSGSGATCFGLFTDDVSRDHAAATCPREWWHLATTLR